MQGVISYDGKTSIPFTIQSGVKEGCILTLTLFGIFFPMLLIFVFRQAEEGV